MTQRDDIEEHYRDFACLNYNTMGPQAFETHTWVYDPARARHNDGGGWGLVCLRGRGAGSWVVGLSAWLAAPSSPPSRPVSTHQPPTPHQTTTVCSSSSGSSDQQCTAKPNPRSNDTRREVRVDHLFDAPGGNARIYLLHDFVAPNECAALKARAGGRLAAAAVTGDSPGEKIGGLCGCFVGGVVVLGMFVYL